MNDFKSWYERKYGKYPGHEGEHYAAIFTRLTDAFAEYVEERCKTGSSPAKETST